MQQPVYSPEALSEQYKTAIQAICEIAISYYMLGRSNDALHALEAGLELGEGKEVSPQDRLKLLLQQAKIFVDDYFQTNRDYDLALETVLSAKKLAESIAEEQGIADSLSLLGQARYYRAMLTGQGDYEDALADQRQALARRETLQDTRGISESLFWMGICYERLHQYDQAQESYLQALAIANQYGHRLERWHPARHLSGIAAVVKGDVDLGLKYARESLAALEEVGFKLYLPYGHLLVGEVYEAKQDLTHALDHCQKALALAEELGETNVVVGALLSIGDIRLAEKTEAEARANYEKARTIAQELQNTRILKSVNERFQRLAQ
ncbi:MAG TPA: tetratricopeptide repeat protein [Ktedonosporobacter sp.]|nr:tetratricopeptide repeat protein [Ktedonosporobacter sp.]